MKTFVIFALLCVLCLASTHAQQSDYEKLKTEAERFYTEASYNKARELYLRASVTSLPQAEARWVAFRLADTTWRAQAATETSDPTRYEEAKHQLEVLVRDSVRVEDRDRVWAEVQESLGDFWWLRRDTKNWPAGWQHYQQALDWWAGSADLETARNRYLKIVWNITRPEWREAYYYYGYYGNYVPLEILENALKIAQSEDDRAHAHYLIAMTIRGQGGAWEQRRRVPEEFEAALRTGKSSQWYDDALYYYAEWLASTGYITPLDNGQWQQQPDYTKALELFQELVRQYAKGETRYYDQAKQQIENITRPTLALSVSNIFLPDSEMQVYLSWRNVKKIDLAIYKVDLTRDVRFPERSEESNFIQSIGLAGRSAVKSWTKETKDKGDHKPDQEIMRLDVKLPTGAYVIEAASLGARSRDLLLVTDTALVLKSSGKHALAYFCNAGDGAPVAGANLTLWERIYNGNHWLWRELRGATNQEGMATFDLTGSSANTQLFAAAALGDRQAFSLGNNYNYSGDDQPWRIYAFTDRPAYRPDETARWKFVARKYNSGTYLTPASQSIEFEITDPQGAKIKEGKARLNAFGSFWDSLELTTNMALGEYRVSFWDEGRHNTIGSAVLFRLEEYKLPEFKVSLQTPEEDGRKKAFKTGEKVEVNVQADYYFGGPVAAATVEVLVYQNPFYQWWHEPRDYPWYYEDLSPANYSYGRGQGQIIKRETLKTDARGKAVLTFDTPRGSQQDFEYTIEARVTDASRREITSSAAMRVTRQRYYVYLQAGHNLYRPQDKVSVNINALDANRQPVEAGGQIKLIRDYWYEIWLDPNGREVKGEGLKRLREKSRVFPPPVSPQEKPWQLKFRGYEHDEIRTESAKTDREGKAEFNFTPEREGYYRITWASTDKDGAPINAETTVWVATGATTDLGYRQGGLEIVVDKDTFRAGQTAPVMLVAPTNDRYVLFSVEGEDIYNYRLVHLTGNVKLIELPIEDKHVPNIFLSAAMVSDRQIFADTKQVIIPPVDHFLNLEVKADREEYQPREEGTLTVTARDQNGKPVAAEVALGLVDESIFYIQQDYAGDPRKFYYGAKRQQTVQTVSTFQQKSYAKLVEGADKQLIDVRQQVGQRSDIRDGDRLAKSVVGGVGEGTGAGRGAGYTADASEERLATNGREFKELNRMTPGAVSESVTVTGGKEPAVQVRSDFRSTILWQPDVITDRDGRATVKVKFPDSLTGWTATARAATSGNQFGIANAATRTKQPLIVRLQAPRFFVVGDAATVSAVINNNTDKPMKLAAKLMAEGVRVEGLVHNNPNGPVVNGHRILPYSGTGPEVEAGAIQVAAGSETRVDWLVSAQQAGAIKLKVTALDEKYADAMEKSFVSYEHGIEKFLSKSGKVRGDSVMIRLDIPKERRADSTSLNVQVTPSMAVTMLDALPYLINYPYGCTEQTMSRFLPTAITAKTLKDLGLKPQEVMGKAFGGIVQETAGQTHPDGKKDFRQLEDMTAKSLARLYDFQHDDGGWGWWKEGESDHFMTAYVVWGLALAEQAKIEVKQDAVDRGVEYLSNEIVEEETNYDEQAWMLHALSVYHSLQKQTEPGRFQVAAFENLWTNRDKLNAYTRALLALSAHYFGYADKAKILIENLENGVKIDSSPDTSIVERGARRSHEGVIATAHWGEDGIYWRWSEGGVEATSFALRALLAIDPTNRLIEPVTNWLIKNRRGAQWSNTRDTAITVLTLNEYLRQSGELKPEVEYELMVNDHAIVTKKITAEDGFTAPSLFTIDPTYLRDGANVIRINRKGGASPIYFSADAKFFSLEEPVTEAGNEIFVRRQYYKLVGRPTLLKGYVYDRVPLGDNESVTSGDRVEVVMTIEAKNNYEYLLFEDLKPAGLEAVQIRSGESLYARELKSGASLRKFGSGAESPATGGIEETDYTGNTEWVYQELRDRKVALFISKLPEGIWEIRYDLRAETPGSFHALPVIGHAMYVPEIRCNADEVRIRVEDRE